MKIHPLSFAVCLLVVSSPIAKGNEHDGHDHHGHTSHADSQSDIQKNLSHLSVEDRQLAVAQKYCPVMSEVVLGEMGTPVKVEIGGRVIVVCCEDCVKQAQSEPAATLASLSEIQDRLATAAEIEASLAGMEPGDRDAAQAQGFCPIMTESALGSMGPPVKVVVAGQTIFVCCKGCGRKAQTYAEKTLATVASLREQVAQDADIEASFASLAPIDRGPARIQKFCAVMNDSRLGSMGTPVRVEIGDKVVYLCCEGCRRKALANSEQTLANAAQLQRNVAAESAE